MRKEPTLINTITVSDNTTSSVEISLDSNSKAFILRNHLTIYIETPVSTENYRFLVMFGNVFSAILLGCQSASSNVFTKADFNWNGYEWSPLTASTTAVGLTGNAITQSKYYAVNKSVQKITITTNSSAHLIPSGTVIKVYGENYA